LGRGLDTCALIAVRDPHDYCALTDSRTHGGGESQSLFVFNSKHKAYSVELCHAAVSSRNESAVNTEERCENDRQLKRNVRMIDN